MKTFLTITQAGGENCSGQGTEETRMQGRTAPAIPISSKQCHPCSPSSICNALSHSKTFAFALL